ncbi:MAG: selenide, water dikinase SelD [Hyphomicrobiaceae bacterium]
MLTGQQRAEKRIVLVGGGHAHVGVIKAFGMMPEPGVELVLIAKELDAPYSGMLPGYVAGHYDLDECHIDLVRLTAFAGVRLVHGEAIGIDRQAKRVLLADRPPLVYDLLSIDTGITPMLADIEGAEEHAIAVKPVSTFAPRWQTLETAALKSDGPRHIAVIGTGAAGFELILAMRHRLRAMAKSCGIAPDAFTFTLIGSGDVLPTHNAHARKLARQALADAGIKVLTGKAATAAGPGFVRLANGDRISADAVLMTTKAQPPAWFAETGLDTDKAGFLAVRPTLQSTNDDHVFAVGDCATVKAYPREKAGVFAVRQGPPLTQNLRRMIRGEPPKPFKPQSQFLTLLSCGDHTAIAARGRFAAAGAWAWRLKDHIDRTFMAKFQILPRPAGATEAIEEMVCAGCAAKLGPLPLNRALDRLGQPPQTMTVRDLSNRDDAALLDLGAPDLRLESLDYFPAIWPEPYVLGEIAAAHALSDIVAKGGTADHALAIAAVARKAPHLAEDDLFQLLAGARKIFDAEGVALVGGHTTSAEELGAGFFVSGSVARGHALQKSGLRPDSTLILTKPLGTGIVFQAWMRGLARAREVASALAEMRRTNTPASRILAACGATAITDVTGFGLAGHLLEALEASAMSAEIALPDVPRLPGVDRFLEAGVRSSLFPDNLARIAALGLDLDIPAQALALLLDPQTSGGLLAGVPDSNARDCLDQLAAAGITAAIIGRTTEAAATAGAPKLRIRLKTGAH